MDVNELSGAALDWAVAKYQGFTDYDPTTGTMLPPRKEYGRVLLCDYAFSTDWEQGGPIIERECIELQNWGVHSVPWSAWIDEEHHHYGTTPLIAAMRCYVASKQGE